MEQYIDVISNNPSLGRYLCAVHFNPDNGYHHTSVPKFLENRWKIFAYAPGVTHISAVEVFCIDWELLPLTAKALYFLGKNSGHSLHRLLDVKIVDTLKINPSLLGSFNALRSLSGHFLAEFDTTAMVSPDWLPNLETLKIQKGTVSLLKVLTRIK